MKNKLASSFVVPLLEPRLARFPHLGVADRLLETPKRARYSASIAKKDKHMNK